MIQEIRKSIVKLCEEFGFPSLKLLLNLDNYSLPSWVYHITQRVSYMKNTFTVCEGIWYVRTWRWNAWTVLLEIHCHCYRKLRQRYWTCESIWKNGKRQVSDKFSVDAASFQGRRDVGVWGVWHPPWKKHQSANEPSNLHFSANW